MIIPPARRHRPDPGGPSPRRLAPPTALLITAATVMALASTLGGCAGVRGTEAPAPQTNVGRQVVDLVQDATAVLSGVDNLPSARDAAPRLARIDTSLTEALQQADRLPQAAQQHLGEVIDGVLPALVDQIERVQEIAGAAGTLRPTVDAMRDKLQAARLQDDDVPGTPYTTPQ